MDAGTVIVIRPTDTLLARRGKFCEIIMLTFSSLFLLPALSGGLVCPDAV